MNERASDNSNASAPDEASGKTTSDAVQRGYELDNVRVRPIGMAVGGLVLLMLSVLGIIALVLGWIGTEPHIKRLSQDTDMQPEVSGQLVPLDPDQPLHLAEIRQQEETKLTSYGWIDQKAGIARIPIERAMQIIAEQGFTQMPVMEPKMPEDNQDVAPQAEGP